MNCKISSKTRFQVGFIFLFCLAVILGMSTPVLAGPAAQDPPPPPTPTQTPAQVATPLPGVPVNFGGQTLFYVYERMVSLSPAERAALISKNIAQLADDPFAPALEITLAESDQGTDLMVGETVLLTVTDADAKAIGMQRDQAAQAAAKKIQETVQNYRQLNTPLSLAQRILIALGTLAIMLMILFSLNRLLRRKLENIERAPSSVDEDDILAKAGLYRTGLWRRFIRLLFNLGMAAAVLILLFVVSPFILRLFSPTARIANQLLAFLTSTLSRVWTWFGEYRGNLFTILLIVVITYALTRLVSAFFAELGQGTIRIGGFDPEWALFTRRIINFLLCVGALVMAFPYIPGSDTEAFRGITIFLGLLLTLSSTAAVTNIVAGVIQTYTGAFRVGDTIKIADTMGVVIEKRLLTTRVRTPKQEEVSIPNSLVLNTSVVNYSALASTTGVILYTTVTIGFDVPWRTVHNLLLSATASTPNLLNDPPPYVLQTSLNDYHISYQLNCYTKCPELMPRIYTALHQNILDAFNQAGVEIMSPAFTALRDGNTITLPVENRPADYQAAGIRVDHSRSVRPVE